MWWHSLEHFSSISLPFAFSFVLTIDSVRCIHRLEEAPVSQTNTLAHTANNTENITSIRFESKSTTTPTVQVGFQLHFICAFFSQNQTKGNVNRMIRVCKQRIAAKFLTIAFASKDFTLIIVIVILQRTAKIQLIVRALWFKLIEKFVRLLLDSVHRCLWIRRCFVFTNLWFFPCRCLFRFVLYSVIAIVVDLIPFDW